MIIFKEINKKPNQVAAELTNLIKPMEMVEKIENVGPYLNFYLVKEKWFRLVLSEILEQGEKYGQQENKNPQKIIVEFSEPNPNKPTIILSCTCSWSFCCILYKSTSKFVNIIKI